MRRAILALRALLARDLGELGDLVDQLALGDAAHREGEAGAKRQAVKDRGQRKPNQRRCEGDAENDDRGVGVREHPQIAAHENERAEHNSAGNKAEAGAIFID